MKINALRLGVIVGLLVALVHALWAGMVALNWAQPFMDYIFHLHFVTPPYQVEPFDMATAGVLIGVTGALGFLTGVVVALVWNAFHHSTSKAIAN